MPDEKHFNKPNWKAKLDSDSHLPGITAAEKDAMWNTLHERLKPARNANRSIGYRIAASLLIILALALYSRQENADVKQAGTIQHQTATAPVTSSPALKEPAVLLLPSTDVKSIMTKEKKIIAAQAVTEAPADSNYEAYVSLQKQPDTISVLSSISPVPDSGASPVNNQKKLMVVHINELEAVPASFETPANYATKLTGKTKKKSSSNLTISNQPNSIGFKIQLSSKN